jgi:hypothetical protein
LPISDAPASKVGQVAAQVSNIPRQSGTALRQLNHPQAKASFISRGPAHIQLPFDQHPSRPVAFHYLDGFRGLPSRKVQLIHVPGPFPTASRRWERIVKKPSRNVLTTLLSQGVFVRQLAKQPIWGRLSAMTSESVNSRICLLCFAHATLSSGSKIAWRWDSG